MTFTLLGFIVYLLSILAVGFITYNINKSHEDYFIAGRRLNPWVVAFSERASGESAWLLLGLPGAAYAIGILEFWTALGCVLGIIFYWYVIAERLRIESETTNSITLPDFFAMRIGEHQNLIRIASTFIIIFFFIFYLAAQFNGAGKVLWVTFGIPEQYGILLGASVIVLYTMMGGFFAVAWTDFIQGVIMIGALVILPLAGAIEVLQEHKSIGIAVRSAGTDFASLTGGTTGWAATAVVLSGMSWGLGYMGQPHLLTRFMSISHAGKIKISRRIAFVWAIPAFTGAMLIGLVGLAHYGSGHFEDVEQIMPQLAKDLLPSWLAGIFVSGAVAAMMSTADSQLLVISSSVIEDFYHKTLGKTTISKKRLLKLSRVITVVVGVIALIISLTSAKLIFQLVSYAWSGLGASFGPALLLLLWWRKITAKGILAGMISGTVMTIVWESIDYLNRMMSVRLIAWVVALFFVVAISLITQNKVSEK